MSGTPFEGATHDELDSLLGAYALDALDPAERARVDAYLAADDEARAEVDEMRETAASLALAPAVNDPLDAPPELWDRIAASLASETADAAPAPPIDLAAARARRRGWSGPVVAIVGVAAAVALVVLIAQVVSLNGRLEDANQPGDRGVAAAFGKAQRTTGARQLALTPDHGAEVARIVFLPDGNGVLENVRMKVLTPGLTYQLWALTGDRAHPTAISAGVLGPAPKGAAFRTSPDAHGFALTIEHAPGVVSSTQPLYASASVA